MAFLRRFRIVRAPDRRSAVEREFDEDYRDPRFPSSWNILPFTGMGALIAVLVVFCF